VSLRLQELGLSPDNRKRLDGLREAIKQQSAAYEAASGAAKASTLQKLIGAREELLQLVQQSSGNVAASSPDFVARTLGHVPTGGALVLPVTTAVGGKLLILTHGKDGPSLTAIDLPGLTSGAVNRTLRGDGSKTGAGGGWLGAFNIQYLPPDQRGERIQEWLAAIETIGEDLWKLFAGRLQAVFAERGLQPGAHVLWLPAGPMGLLPVGLAQDPAGGGTLADTYQLVTLPSLEALEQSSRQAKSATEISLAAAVNPTGEIPDMTLPFTEIEGALVARHFAGRPQTILDKTNASPAAVLAALKGKSYWHFSSHGAFDWSDARQAGLIMRGEVPLTIGALLAEEGRLGRPRLVALSACETGLYDTSNNAEEFVGLPATFLQLGAAGVVATLWQVDDLATALLMAKFYDLHLAEKLAPPTALKRAQAWLREATRDELIAYGKASATAAKLDTTKLGELESTLATMRRARSTRFNATWSRLQNRGGGATGSSSSPANQVAPVTRPFAHPYYWGGFVYTGL
jgi:CHAT domain-containing protein